MLYLCSEFDLPWFDLDVREAKDSVRTTRSRAKAAKPSTAAESSGICTYRVPLHLIRKGEERVHIPKWEWCVCVCGGIPINAHHYYLGFTISNAYLHPAEESWQWMDAVTRERPRVVCCTRAHTSLHNAYHSKAHGRQHEGALSATKPLPTSRPLKIIILYILCVLL